MSTDKEIYYYAMFSDEEKYNCQFCHGEIDMTEEDKTYMVFDSFDSSALGLIEKFICQKCMDNNEIEFHNTDGTITRHAGKGKKKE